MRQHRDHRCEARRDDIVPDISIDLERETRYTQMLEEVVRDLARGLRCRIFLFGSRARGEVRRSSDFDLGVAGLDEASFRRLKTAIEEFVEESLIPHEVDVVNFDAADDRFRAEAMKDVVVWKTD
jgi:uncharacterized protein